VANEKFAAGEYDAAIKIYAEAISSCPSYLYYERAVLNSNVAACYLKLEQWKETAKAASESLDDLDRLDPVRMKEKKEKEMKKKGGLKGQGEEEIVDAPEEEADEEIISLGATKAEDTSEAARRKADIERIRSKALLRRGRARSELGGWSALGGAEEGMLCYCLWCGVANER
jgi:tetratricopeptide (TPR) repeat protein